MYGESTVLACWLDLWSAIDWLQSPQKATKIYSHEMHLLAFLAFLPIEMTDFLPFHILQLVKSLPFHIPEAWKKAHVPLSGGASLYRPKGSICIFPDCLIIEHKTQLWDWLTRRNKSDLSKTAYTGCQFMWTMNNLKATAIDIHSDSTWQWLAGIKKIS